MKNFKNMKDVFSLPVKPKNVEHWVNHPPAKRYVCHAINHVDALADALNHIVMNKEDEVFEEWLDKNHPSGDVSEVQYKFENSSEYKDFIAEYGCAVAALAAYRGEV